MAKKKKINTEAVVTRLMEVADDNGYTIAFNGTDDGNLHIIAYPYKGTLTTQEFLARALYEVLDEEGVTEEEAMKKFREDVTPDDIDELIFQGKGNDVHFEVFHNKNILVKQIVMKL